MLDDEQNFQMPLQQTCKESVIRENVCETSKPHLLQVLKLV